MGKALLGATPDDALGRYDALVASPDYWRANLEMASGDTTVQAAALSLLLAAGHVERAERLLEPVMQLGGAGSGAQVLGHTSASWGPVLFRVAKELEAGRAEFDGGDAASAERRFDALIASGVCSAAAHHERLLARGAASEEWPSVRAEIMRCDPLFSPMLQASGPREVFESMRRLEASRAETMPPEEGLPALGAIAFDVGDFVTAAHLYNFAVRMQPNDEARVRMMGALFVAAEAAGATGFFDAVMPGSEQVRAAMETFKAEAAERAP